MAEDHGHERSEPAGQAERSEPAGQAARSEPAGQAARIEVAERTERSEPTERTEPARQIDGIEPAVELQDRCPWVGNVARGAGFEVEVDAAGTDAGDLAVELDFRGALRG